MTDRGLKDVEMQRAFLRDGGTELAPMSTTSDLEVALRYSRSDHSVLLRLRTKSAMERGADIRYLSVFPHEREYLYPPLVYLQPAAAPETVQLGGRTFSVVQVEPRA